MAIQIPGADVLGYGFNVFGTYDPTSKIQPLFDMTYQQGHQWQRGDITYLVPDNAALDSSSAHYGDSYAFSSRQKVQEHFASKVSMSGSYGFFSAEFEALYSETVFSDTEYSFGLVESFSRFWRLELKDQSQAALAPWVRNDPDYQNLPDEFTPENRALFFRFFDKYGTTYVTGASLGARLFYSCSIAKSYQYSEKTVAAKMKMEYDAIFVRVSGEASAEWHKVGQQWAEQRSVKVQALGGDNRILTAILPGWEDNFNDEYRAWLDSAPPMPAVIDFRLAPIDNLFSGKQAAAVSQAIAAYTKSRIFAESKTGSCMIVVNGEQVLPAGGGDQTLGFQLAAVNRETQQLAAAKSYSVTYRGWRSEYPKLYEKALQDFMPYRSDRYILAMATWSNFGIQLPTEFFYELLLECGAGVGLEKWLSLKDLPKQDPLWYSCNVAHCNYVLIGTPGIGKGKGFENFQRAPSCDTGSGPWHPSQGWFDVPAPMASVEVDLFRIADRTLAELSDARTSRPQAISALEAVPAGGD